MDLRLRLLLICLIACVALPQRSPAPVIFKPSEKVKYQAPGEEEISGNATELFEKGQAAERDGNTGRAIKAYRKMVKRYPHATNAAEALFREARLLEQDGNLLRAAATYRQLMEDYPNTPHFQEAIESQFRIGEMYLNGKKVKVLGIPLGTSMDDAAEIFAAIVRSAPYGRYTARAQYDIGRAREKEGSADLAIDAYRSLVEKFPNDPLAADAQYQIGYIWYTAARTGTYDPAAADEARTAFQDFLFKYPKSEKAPQARENLQNLSGRQTKSALEVAKYYDKQKHYRSAVIYYNEVIRQQPGSPESAAAQKRINELRAKVGDAALQPAAALAEKNAKEHPPKKTLAQGAPPTEQGPAESHAPAAPDLHGGPMDLAPLPSSDDSLPPAASTEASPAPSATPESSPPPGSP